MKNKVDLIKMQDGLKKIPLWKLIIYTAEIENDLFALKKQGVKSTDNTYSKKRWIRNGYRKILFEKLKEWMEKKDTDSLSYSDTLEDLKFKEI